MQFILFCFESLKLSLNFFICSCYPIDVKMEQKVYKMHLVTGAQVLYSLQSILTFFNRYMYHKEHI